MTSRHPVILASASAIRAQLLDHAGVACSVVRANVDEAVLKLRHGGSSPAELARHLAAAKALSVSQEQTGSIVIGADQVLNFNGKSYDKPASRTAARDQLMMLRGRRHSLETAVCCAQGGEVVWAHAVAADLTMREFSDEFLDAYLDRMGDEVITSAGGYKLEAPGIQLFSRIDGDYFGILGLPLLPLLDFLRRQGRVAT
jgi:septum formation protein